MLYTIVFKWYSDESYKLRMLKRLVDRATNTTESSREIDLDLEILVILVCERQEIVRPVLMLEVAKLANVDWAALWHQFCTDEDELLRLREERKSELASMAKEKALLFQKLSESKVANNRLKRVMKEKNALAERLRNAEATRKRFDEELKRCATENVTREKVRQSLGRRELLAKLKGRSVIMKSKLLDVKLLLMGWNLNCRPMRIFNLGSSGPNYMINRVLDITLMINTIFCFCNNTSIISRLRCRKKCHVMPLYMRKGSPAGSPLVSPHPLPQNHGLYPADPPPVAVELPPFIIPSGVAIHNNGHMNDCGMNTTIHWPYYDPDFDSLSERVHGPVCRVTIDNESLDDCTVIKIDSVNKKGLLLEVVQVLTDMNLTILKGYISSDAGWFMDVFHVEDDSGNKVTDQNVINYIQKAIGASREATVKAKAGNTKLLDSTTQSRNEPTALIEMTGKDRPGLFSEISAALADLHINVVEAHAWSHNARLACVAYISEQSTATPIDDHRLAAIEDHLTTVLRATTLRSSGDDCTNQQEVKHAAGLPDGEGTMTDVERRLHQLMLSVRDFDRPSGQSGLWWMPNIRQVGLNGHEEEDEKKKDSDVSIESCDEKGYSIVTVSCKDRRRLMFDTVCTLTDMQYVIFHASVDSHEGYAFQEYFIRHIDGCALNTEGEKERVIKCLEAAIERRVCEGVRLELCATNRVGLLSDITRVLRENGLAVVRADIATQGEKAVNAFYVRDISGNNVDMEFIESMKREMGVIDLAVKNETTIIRPNSSGNVRPRFSIGDILKSQIERLSQNFIAIR
ncbi:hypothetical protein ACH5RR_040070 [Cinchona calisaya]|uniref:ACT domain-containing protein ACR n=1 Tax=Cinchona calisaya TaxID=153742 RepID=A0ABD2XRS9_9GENT